MGKATVLVNQVLALCDHPLFAYQCCQFIIGSKYGTDEAKSFKFEYRNGSPVRLIIKNAAGDIVLNKDVGTLQNELKQAKQIRESIPGR